MAQDFRCHDISDRIWALLEPHLPGRKGSSGRNAKDNRNFINAVIWILRTGTLWRDLPHATDVRGGIRTWDLQKVA